MCFATPMALRKVPSASGCVALEQDFAARPMQLRFDCAVVCPFRRRQCFVEDGEGAVRIAHPGFAVGQRDLQEA